MTDFPYQPGQSACHPDLLDTRDIPLGSLPPKLAADQLPAAYTDPAMAALPVEDQNGSSSCVGQTFSKGAEVLDYYDTAHQPANLSAKFLYSRIALPGGGAYLRDACKVLQEVGCAKEATDPSYPATEDRMTQRDERPETLTEAGRYRIKSFASVVMNVPEIKRAIFEGHFCGTGMAVSSEGWGGAAVKKAGYFVRPPLPGESSGGHAFALFAWDDTKACPDGSTGAFLLRNSWSTGWGKNGNAWVSYKDAPALFTGWTLVDIPDELLDAAKSMYQLVRSPKAQSEVYARAGKVVRHLANWQTLVLGDADPDRYWVVPRNGNGDRDPSLIPVVPAAEWETLTVAPEIHLDPVEE